MKSYKFRAECQIDVVRFLRLVEVSRLVMTKQWPFPDVDVEFDSNQDIAVFKKALATVVDGHVMLETIALASEYTGERL